MIYNPTSNKNRLFDVDLATLGLHRLRHTIHSADRSTIIEDIDGMEGIVATETKRTTRRITVDFLLKSTNLKDYDKKRDKIIKLFSVNEPFYIEFKREPNKLWQVMMNETLTIPPSRELSQFTVTFECMKLYSEEAESTGWVITQEGMEELDKIYNLGSVLYEGTEDLVPFRDDYSIRIKGTPIEGAESVKLYTYSGNNSEIFTYNFAKDTNYVGERQPPLDILITGEGIKNHMDSIIRYTNKVIPQIPAKGVIVSCRNFKDIEVDFTFTNQYS